MKKHYRTWGALLYLGSVSFFVGDVVDDPHAHDFHDQAVVAQDKRRLNTLIDKVQQGTAQQNKAAVVAALVHKGVAHIAQRGVEKAMHDFTFDPQFVRGESYLFVYDLDGVCWAHGRHKEFIWHNRYNARDERGVPYVQDMIRKARAGGGWVSYMWRNVLKRSYVALAQHGNRTFIVGAGYYSHNAENSAIDLVEMAVAYFNYHVYEHGADPVAIFDEMNKKGRFGWGRNYIFAVDMDNGLVVVHTKRPYLQGADAWGYEDGDGLFINQEIAKKLATTEKGIWQPYMSNNAPKLAYARKVVDPEGRSYFIASGYYPTVTENSVVELVRKGHQHLKTQGAEVTRLELQDPYEDAFRFGDLGLTVYDYNGTIIASGKAPGQVGSTISQLYDDRGNNIFVAIRDKAREGGGWLAFRSRNAYRSVYVEPVVVGQRKFIVASGTYPLGPEVEIEIMVQLAVAALKREPLTAVLPQFSDPNGPFIRGDMMIYVVSEDGIVLAWGDEKQLLWKNMLDARDDDNRPFVRILLEETKAGSVQLSFTINDVPRITYAQSIESADGKRYVVGSAFFV